jgi:hypothetical protein
MLDAGIADPSLYRHSWTSSKTPASFVGNAFNAFIEKHGARDVRRRFFLNVSIGLDEHGGRIEADEGEAVIILQSVSAAFVTLGKSIKWLDRVHPQLPATVVSRIRSLGDVFRIYDWANAEEYRELWREQVEMGDVDEYNSVVDGGGSVKVKLRRRVEEALKRFDVEHPPILLPSSIRRQPLSRPALEKIARKRDPRLRAIVEQCLEIDAVHRALKKDRTYFECQKPFTEDMGWQLPVMLLVMDEHDRICASFDEEAHHMLEGGDEAPNAVFPVGLEPAAMRQAFGFLELTVRLFAAVARLIDLLPGNEKWVAKEKGRRLSIAEFSHHNRVLAPVNEHGSLFDFAKAPRGRYLDDPDFFDHADDDGEGG